MTTQLQKHMSRLLRSARESISSATRLTDSPNHEAITLSDAQAILNAASQCTQAARELNELLGVLSGLKFQKIDLHIKKKELVK